MGKRGSEAERVITSYTQFTPIDSNTPLGVHYAHLVTKE